MSPTQRSIAFLKAQGFALVQKVEHWNSFAHIRQDLWGCDIIAVSLTPPLTMLVQTTSGAHSADHVEKLRSLPSTDLLKTAGIGLQVHAWRKLKKTKKWEPLITNL